MKPYIHAQSCVRRWGGKVEDYLPIHDLMDSSKGAVPDNRHRVLTHNSWFIQPDGILERVFGKVIVNGDGKEVSVRDIGELHILEDFGMKYIPTAQDYIENMDFKDWMQNGKGYPGSHEKIYEKRKAKIGD
jgi:hypothetical protein